MGIVMYPLPSLLPLNSKWINSMYRFVLFSITLFSSISFGCNSPESIDAYLTAQVERRPYTSSVVVDGELEAKVARTITVPRVRMSQPPLVGFLAEEGHTVKKDEIIAVFESESLLLEYRLAIDELAIAQADAEQKTADMKLQRLLLEADMRRMVAAASTARLQLPKLEFAAPRMRQIEQLEMEKAEIEADKIRKKLEFLADIEIEETTHLKLKIQQARTKLEHAEETLNQLVLKAPVDGLIVRTRHWSTGNKIQEGDNVYPGMPVAKLPDMSIMQVKVMVGETESKRIKIDQKARVTIPSLNLDLPGHVTQVANVAKPIKRNSQVKRVDVVIEIDSTYTGLVPGLSASVQILAEEENDRLVIPVDGIFEQDSLKVVYLRDGGKFIPRPVLIDRQSADFAIINEGVIEGDHIALRKPSPALIER